MPVTPLEALQRWFGHSSFRGQQLDVIEHVAGGEHALVIMPTGMGKSLCFQIPALMQREAEVGPEITVVLSPLIALMKDQVDGLRRKDIDATFINSSLTREQRLRRYEEVGQGKYAMLYVTPERFRKEEFLDVMSAREVQLLAVDEAHCISEWGHDFRPDYTRLSEFRAILGNPTTIALTATATPDVQADIVRQLGLAPEEMKLYHEGINRPNLDLEITEVWDIDDKLEQIKRVVNDERFQSGSGIIYFTLIRTLDEFSGRLDKMNIDHVCYHGDLDRKRRQRIQNQFMDGECPLVLATNAFGMGVDKEDIRFVVHADVPGSMEAYYQEIGRAGRDGDPSLCLLLYDQRDLMTQMEFIRWSNPDAQFYRRVYDFVANEREKLCAFGTDWLRSQLHFKDSHDHRMETVLAMLERYGVVEGNTDPYDLRVIGDIPPRLCDQDALDEKLERDQRKLLALVEYTKHDGDRKEFIHHYFGLPYGEDA